MSEVKVTQADRDAAAKMFSDWFGAPPHCRETHSIRMGKCDHFASVQAFARHRQSATTEPLAAMEQARVELETAMNSADPHTYARQALATLTEQIERMRNEQG